MKFFDLKKVDLNKRYITPIRKFRNNRPQYIVQSKYGRKVILSAYIVETRRNREEDFDNWYGDYIIAATSEKAIQVYFNWLTSNGYTYEDAIKFECKVLHVNDFLSVDVIRQILKKQEEITGERIL